MPAWQMGQHHRAEGPNAVPLGVDDRTQPDLADRPSVRDGDSEPRYFARLLEEALAEDLPPDCCTRLHFNLGQCKEHSRRAPVPRPAESGTDTLTASEPWPP